MRALLLLLLWCVCCLIACCLCCCMSLHITKTHFVSVFLESTRTPRLALFRSSAHPNQSSTLLPPPPTPRRPWPTESLGSANWRLNTKSQHIIPLPTLLSCYNPSLHSGAPQHEALCAKHKHASKIAHNMHHESAAQTSPYTPRLHSGAPKC